MTDFSPNYEYIIGETKEGISLRLTGDLNDFNPALLNIGDIKKPSKSIQVISVVFDLEGFTNFTKQVDPELSIPYFISEFFDWLFDKIKNQSIIVDNFLYTELPFFCKFMGDGALFLWKIDMDKIAKMGEELPSDKLSDAFNRFICNIVTLMFNVYSSYAEFYKSAKRKYVDPPGKLRCGIARGNVFPIGSGLDFVGPCINISSRLQKFNGLSFAFSARGFYEELFHEDFRKIIIKKSVNIRGIGDGELIYVLKEEFDALPEELKSNFKEL